MEIKNAIDLAWKDEAQTVFDASVTFDGVEYMPFATTQNADTDYGVRLWSDGIAGKYGLIAPYVPPEPEPTPVPEEISRRQFFQQLAVMEIITKAEALAALQSGAIPAPLQAIIDQLPTEDDKFNAEMLVVGASIFERSHPLSETVRLSLGWSESQRDQFWIDAALL